MVSGDDHISRTSCTRLLKTVHVGNKKHGKTASRYETLNNGVDIHPFIHSSEVPVIVAEIGSQRVDIEDQSHGDAQQFCEHFSPLQHTRAGNFQKTEQNKK